MTENDFGFSEEMTNYVNDLLNKAEQCNERTEKYSNCALVINGVQHPMKVDDLQLLTVGALLLPNMLNYLVNILPQFLYPYVIAYLQELSTMREDPVTLNELFNLLSHGNIFDGAETSH